MMLRAASAIAVALVFTAVPAKAETPCAALGDAPLAKSVMGHLGEGPQGARFGLLVTTMEGEPLVSIAPDERFIPASNTKMFTTALAFSQLERLETTARGTGVSLENAGAAYPNVILYGRGDARLSGAADCTINCLKTLADAVAARTKRVHHVVGDDRWFPDERWGPGMSWNNIQSRYGTGISALTIDDNELALSVTAGAIGTPPRIAGPAYFTIDNELVTVAGKETAISAERAPGSRVLRLTGTIGAEARAATLRFGIDDPAHYAAWRLRDLLTERGVTVEGDVMSRHRPLAPGDDPAKRAGAAPSLAPEGSMLAELEPRPLTDDLRIINKDSQNLYSELMLRRVARAAGSGSIADGQAALRHLLGEAGLAETSYGFSDGSGMSSYNRMSPRAGADLLRWIARQPWGDAWRATLPIAGVDGTLAGRFKGTILEGRLFAKTGSLNASRALSGYLVTRNGRTLIFSALANDMPDGTDSKATAAVDKALVAIAEAL